MRVFMEKIQGFVSLSNIRDLGGIKTADGKKIRRNRLIRSGHLSNLNKEETDLLKTLVSVIVDFRTDEECARQPDCSIVGVRYCHLPASEKLAGISREEESDQSIKHMMMKDPFEAKKYMCTMYETLGKSPVSAKAYSSFLQILLENRERGSIFHCTAGKDRAGCAAAVIETILGVSHTDVVEDYLLTNTFIKGDVERLKKFLTEQAGVKEDEQKQAESALQYLFGADLEYIDSFFHAIDRTYGSFENYVHDALMLSDDDIETLRCLYLE